MNSSNKRATYRLTLATLVMNVCAVLLAQDPGSNENAAKSNGVESQQKTVSAVVRRGGVQSQINAFFKELEQEDGIKMHQGINKRPKEQGGDFFVATGVGAISASRSSKDWATSRAVAYDKAMNQAKDNLLTFVMVEVETMTKRATEESTSGIKPDAPSQGQETEAGEEPNIFDKITKLTRNKLDDMLAKQGRKPNSDASVQPPKTEMDKILRTEEFKNFVRLTSRAVVAGMQTFQTFEDLKSGRNGEIAVIGIVSHKTLDLASSVGSGNQLPKGKPSRPIAEQVPNPDTEDGALQLLNTFGVKAMFDENGDLVLVSFNQACPVNDSTDAELSAQRRAGVFAIGEIRRFLGEQIARVEDAFRSESAKDFEDHTRETEATEGGRFAYEARAENIVIVGIGPVMDWTARHPVTGQIIVGSVKMWSPSGKAFAGMLRGKMARAAAEAAISSPPAAAPTSAPSGGRKQINSDQEGDLKGRGIRGDKGGF